MAVFRLWVALGGKGIRRAVKPALVARMVRESAEARIRWHAIFNDALDVDPEPSYDGTREMVYGRRDAANSTAHASQSLPALREWGRHALRLVRRAYQGGAGGGTSPLRLADLGYVRTDGHRPQHWHRDVPHDHRGAAFSVFMPVNMACPRNDPGAFRWRPLNTGRTRAMPIERPGDIWVMDSRCAHRGGARPRKTRERYRVIAFASIVAAERRRSPDYGLSVPL